MQNTDRKTSRTKPSPRDLCNEGACCVLMLLAVVAVGCYATFLNGKLYQHTAPFFDSMSYHEQCFRAMHDAQADGVPTALIENMQGTITVCLPQAMAIVMSMVMEPSRSVGILIQVLFLAAFELTLFAFFRQQMRLGRMVSMCGCVCTLALGCLMLPVGGLSDFRMDLLLMLNLATSCLLVVMALGKTSRETRVATWMWLAAGGAIAATCLCRATAPVYLVVMLAPVILLTFVFDRQTRWSQLGGATICGIVAACGCLWFYMVNFEHLRYYYVEWNTDANAGLTYFQSLGHLRYVRKAIGVPLLVFFLVSYLLVLTNRNQRAKLIVGMLKYKFELAVLAWIGVAPIAILVAKRAGMNPFVSMPAVIGIVAGLVVPLLAITRSKSDQRRLAYGVCAVWVASMFLGYNWHTKSEFNSMQGRQEVLRSVAAESDGRANMSVVTLGKFNTSSLMSTLLFDVDATRRRPGNVRWKQVDFHPKRLFQIAAQTEWDSVHGSTDQDKVQTLFQQATRQLDFVVIPTQETAALLSLETSNRIINGHAELLRRRFLDSSKWLPVSNPIETEQGQHFVVLKRIDQVNVAGTNTVKH